MIFRTWISFRLLGRRRHPVPTTTLEGLAHLLVTGSFHRWREEEALPAGEMARRYLACLPPDLAWTRAEEDAAPGIHVVSKDIPRELARIDLRHAGSADGLPCIGTLRFRSSHPRGRPALTVELTMVPTPAEAARGEDLTRVARRSFEDGRVLDSMTRKARATLEGLEARVIEVTQRALPVESFVVDHEEGAVTRWSPPELADFPASTAAWLAAVAELAVNQPALFGETLSSSVDFAGWLDEGTVADGGGSFDSGGAGTGGGHLGGA